MEEGKMAECDRCGTHVLAEDVKYDDVCSECREQLDEQEERLQEYLQSRGAL